MASLNLFSPYVSIGSLCSGRDGRGDPQGKFNGGVGRMSNTEMREEVLLKDFIYSIIITKDRTIQ